ncbi:MAG: hypothetical protein Tsb0018_11130 [Opitutales bacterium]
MSCSDTENNYSSAELEELMKLKQILQLSHNDIDALNSRLEEAVEYGMTLDKDDGKVLSEALKAYAHMQERLAANDLTISKLRKLLGMETSSEKSRSSSEKSETNGDNEDSDKVDPGKPTGNPKHGGHGKRSASEFKAASTEHHKLARLCKGDLCPECHQGKLYKYEPSILIRISAHEPVEVVKHVCERLRCNSCGEFFTAELDAAVLADGEKGQRFGYSARALMAINKYLAGSPFFRQQTLAEILGTPISASTIFD